MQAVALKALYDETGGSTTWIPNNWFQNDSSDNICSFDGIECDISTGIADNVTLSEFGISGTIPDEIYLLQPLWNRLDMSNNNLTGTVSSEILSCCNETLILSNNSLTGPVPNLEQEQLTVIKVDLSGNAFSGEISLEFLRRELSDINTAATWSDYLQELLLNDNSLSGEIPTELGSMKSLTFLLLQNNKFDGSLPSEFGNLRNLRELNVGYNLVEGTLPSELGQLLNLVNFDISGNGLNGTLPSELGYLQSLQELHTGENQFSGSLPEELSNLSALQVFNLGANNFEGSIADNMFDNMKSLTSFSLSSSEITGTLPAGLSNLSCKLSHFI